MTSPVWQADQYEFGEGFQAKVVALCLRDPGFLQARLDVINANYFDNRPLGILCNLVKTYFTSQFLVPTREALTTMVYDYVRAYGGDKAAEELQLLSVWVDHVYAADLKDAPFITEKVVEFGQRQAIKQAVGKTIDLLEAKERDVSKYRECLDEALRVGSPRQMGTDFGAICLDIADILKNDPIYGIKNKVPTGFRVLDDRLSGGVGAGEVMVVGAVPGRGKTTAMVNVGRWAALHFGAIHANKTVVYITLEGGMKEIDISLRFSAAFTGFPMNDICAGNPAYREAMQAVRERAVNARPVIIKYFPPGTASLEDIRWYIANLMSVEGIDPGMIIIDYADKLKGMENDRYEGAGAIYDGFTALGDKFRCPMITGSQVNRDWAGQPTVDGRGLADSWLKLANCDVLVTMNQTPEEQKAKIMRLYLAKVRKGESLGTIYCNWHADRSGVWQMTESEAAKAMEAVEVDLNPSTPGGKGKGKH